MRRRRQRKGLSALIAEMFAASQQGALTDVGDFTTLFQDSTGTTPFTAVEQFVGLMLDKRLGLVRGAEVFTGFPAMTTVNANGTVATSPSNVICTCTVAGLYGANGGVSALANTTYELTISWSGNTNGRSIAYDFGSSGGGLGTAVSGTLTRIIRPASAGGFNVYASGGLVSETFTVSVVSAKVIAGNHAIQATAASRLVGSARVNLLLATEGALATYPVSSNVINASVTIPGFAASVHFNDGVADAWAYKTFTPISGPTYTLSVFVQMDDNGVPVPGAAADAAADFSTVIYNGVAVGAVVTPTANPLVFLVRISGVSAAAVSTNFGVVKFAAHSARTFKVTGYQLDIGTTATRYQRVNTDTDYDTAGFPVYTLLDGGDDSMSSATGGGGTAGFAFCQAIKRTGVGGALRTIWSDAGTNSGYKVELNASNQLSFSAGNGTAYTTIATATATTVGPTHLITVGDDGINLSVQLDDGAIATIARPVVTAGTAGYTMGKDNGAASGFFTGNLYSLFYRQTALTAAERLQAQLYVRSKAGL